MNANLDKKRALCEKAEALKTVLTGKQLLTS